MFICENCNKQSGPKEKQTKTVIKTRNKVYPDGNIGTEIVKEINIGPCCVNKKKEM